MLEVVCSKAHNQYTIGLIGKGQFQEQELVVYRFHEERVEN